MKELADEAFYTPEEVAKKLKLSITTIYNLIKSKDIPSVRIGKCFRIPESELLHIFRGGKPIIPESSIHFVGKLTKAPFHKKIVDVILFGSYARGEPNEDSDIDLLLIYTNLNPDEREQLVRIEDEASRETGYLDNMNVIKKSLLQWKVLEKQKTGIYRTITNEGISLWKK